MNFISIEFIIFFVLLLIILKLTKGKKCHQIILLIASYLFYFWGDANFLVILIIVSFLAWFVGEKINNNRFYAKRYLIVAVIVDIMILSIFKYLNFFADGFSKLLGHSWTALNIVLPIGISFYIFQAISYVVDVYNRKIEAEKALWKVLLYVGFFPQILSGPIVKAYDFFPQLEADHELTKENLSCGVQRFITGVFKKIVVADRLSVCVNAVYSAPNCYSGKTLTLTVLAYALEIYYDFSGYSDMAIGVANVLGFDLKMNFNLPYLAKNPSDFWRRWHISLSNWFKEYVYIPLGGSKKGRIHTYINLFITMLLSGIWHGINWGFILWGIAHAFLAVLNKCYIDIKKKCNISVKNRVLSKSISGLSTLIMFVVVALLWVPFRVNDFSKIKIIYIRMLTNAEGVRYSYVFIFVFVFMLFAVETMAILKNRGNDIWQPIDLNKFSGKIIFLIFVFSIVIFGYVGDNVFIYANF